MNPDDMLSMPVRDFIAAVAAKTPTPGGGSVAGVVGSLATALGEMALNFTRGKKKYAEHEAFHSHMAMRLERQRVMFQDLVADDMSAYGFYQETVKQPEGPARDEAMQLAVSAAINVPREMQKLGLALLEDLKSMADKCSPMLISDLVAGAALAVAAVNLSDYNVRINAPALADKQAGQEMRMGSRADLAKARELLAEIEQATSGHMA